MRAMLPNYPAIAPSVCNAQPLLSLGDLFGGRAELVSAETPAGVGLILVDAPHLFARPGGLYLDQNGKDWPDNHRRFAALSWAAAHYAATEPDGWPVDILHGHDWQAGLTPVYARLAMQSPPPFVMTIHNIAFGGFFPAGELKALRLPPALYNPEGIEFYGRISFLKAGLVFSQRITTVSPSYAVELQSDDGAMGFQGVLRARRNELTGILNGIDDRLWDPGSDPHLARHYTSRTLKSKQINKSAVQAIYDLEPDAGALLMVVVSRLTDQKGLDLLAAALPSVLERGGQLALLGSGSPSIEALFQALSRTYLRQVGVRFGYDEPLSHQLIAGGDAIIVPSRYEPCGLTQLYGLRYGTVPIVARTGGLAELGHPCQCRGPRIRRRHRLRVRAKRSGGAGTCPSRCCFAVSGQEKMDGHDAGGHASTFGMGALGCALQGGL